MRRGTAILVGLMVVLVAVSLATRPLFPIDETRYVSVAWDMWLRGDFLVPHLNGAPYSHKPPLLFWLFHAGWWLFGVSEWWPRLVPALFSLASVFVTARVAALLWSQQTEVARLAPPILLGSLLWLLYSTFTMFDLLVACCALFGILGVLIVARRQDRRGWLVLGAAIGLGVLAKGPVILLYTLPPALLAPWWSRGGVPGGWARWYLGVLGAVALGALIALAWAVPAAVRGGEAYRDAIFWGQTAGRMVDSFAHGRPWWWYLPLLPLALFPWLLWPPLWRGLARLRNDGLDSGSRFCLAWMLPSFVVFSLISGKQPHYLLPLFPGFALLAGRVLSHPVAAPRGADQVLPGIVYAIGGVILLVSPLLAEMHELPEWARRTPLAGGAALLLLGLLLSVLTRRARRLPVLALLAANVFAVTVFHLEVVRAGAVAYDLEGVSGYLNGIEAQGHPIANAGKYYGQYHFLGRLHKPLDVLHDKDLDAWVQRHPGGRVIVYYDDWLADPPIKPDYSQLYRGGALAVWRSDTLRAHPALAHDWR